MKKLLFVFYLGYSLNALSQTETIPSSETTMNSYAERDFLIIASTKNIKEAFTLAKKAAEKTGYQFKDNALQKDSVSGATFPLDTCKTYGFEFPCYLARGRYDDGAYFSVEYSDAYTGFKKGYFIVVAANGFKDNENFKTAVKKIKLQYPKSYIKRTSVYLGCMH